MARRADGGTHDQEKGGPMIAKSWNEPFGAYLTGASPRGAAVCAMRLLNHAA
jgi:hypothetical protein